MVKFRVLRKTCAQKTLLTPLKVRTRHMHSDKVNLKSHPAALLKTRMKYTVHVQCPYCECTLALGEGEGGTRTKRSVSAPALLSWVLECTHSHTSHTQTTIATHSILKRGTPQASYLIFPTSKHALLPQTLMSKTQKPVLSFPRSTQRSEL
jgi:hypothetical protein